MLAAEGREVAKENAAQWPDVWERVNTAANRLRSASIQDYVRLAIAAKTDLLTRQVGRELPPETLKEKAAEHGWKAFTPEQYAEAMKFLQTVVGAQPQATKA